MNKCKDNTHQMALMGRPKLAYLAFFEDCERRAKAGQTQQKCPSCGLWYWPERARVRVK